MRSGGMNFSQSFRLAIKSLTTSKMRALLTMLGIIIGVGAVIVILSLGNGLTGMVQQQVDKLGINMIQAQFFGGTADMLPDPEDMYDLVEANADILTGVSPYLGVNAVVRHGSDKFDRTSLYGVSEIMYNAATGYTIDGEQLAKGRFISYMDVERRENICVIGAYLEEEAFGGDALGKQLSINGLPLTVVGVLKRNAELEMLPGSRDDQIYIPYTTALEIVGSRWVNVYIFTSSSGETAQAAKNILVDWLNSFFRTEDGMWDYFYITTMAEQANQINAMMGVAMGVLVAIAAISLLVGGIGIMNIMLVSVTERTREIGVRKSLGAKRRDIRSQFVIEAGTTSAIGGILGIGFGWMLAKGIGALLGGMLSESMGGGVFDATPTFGAIMLSFGVSVGIGVLFGYLPANKAAKLNPIDALRYD
jgi:putative ABC transport system permease protein